MFIRLRWYVLGVLSTVGAGAYLRVKRIRRRMSGRGSLHLVADTLDAAARRVGPPGPHTTRR